MMMAPPTDPCGCKVENDRAEATPSPFLTPFNSIHPLLEIPPLFYQSLQMPPTMALPSLLLFPLLSLVTPSLAGAAFQRIYAFGDSYTDTGNTNSSTGPTAFNHVSDPPYGRTFFRRPTNRYSDGRLVIDFVAAALSLPSPPPYLRSPLADAGVNFAVAGATAIEHRFFVENNLTLDLTPHSLETQLQWFLRVLKGQGCDSLTGSRPQCDKAFDGALVWVGEIGVNDYAYAVGSDLPHRTIQDMSLRSVARFLEEIVKMGAKHIVVQGLPATGCLPLAMVLVDREKKDDVGCVAAVNEQSRRHNTALQGRLDALSSRFPHIFLSYADYGNSYLDVMRNAPAYGFREIFRACCGSGSGTYNFNLFVGCGSPGSTDCPDPSHYVNWDGVHLTDAMHRVVAHSFLDGRFCHPPFFSA